MSNDQVLFPVVHRNGRLEEPDQSARFYNLFIGGGFQMTGLALNEDKDLAQQTDRVKLAFVDTDANHLETLPEEQKLVLDQVRAAALLEAIERHPERFPGAEQLGDLNHKWRGLGAAESLPAGLMTRRELGALVLDAALWRQPAQVRNFTLMQIRQLHQDPRSNCWRISKCLRKKLHLILSYFFSSCGGTGSSLAVLFEDLQRHLLNTDEGFTALRFVAHILLPGPMLHRAIDPTALKYNTYALLLELMERYAQRCSPLQLGSYHVPRAHRPFEHLYLYDEINLKGRIFASREEINDMVKEVWKLQNLGPEGQEYQSRLVDYHLEYPNIFSSAGCWILEFPAELIEVLCALDSGADWIHAYPLFPLDEGQAQKASEAHLTELLNRQPGLHEVSRLTRDQTGKPIVVRLAAVSKLPRRQLPQAVADAVHRQLEQIAQTFQQLAHEEEAHLSAVLITEVQALLNRKGGPALAQQFLQYIRSLFQEQQSHLETQVDRARRERDQHEEQAQRQRQADRWQRLSFNYRSTYLKQTQRQSDSQVHELRQAARLSIVNRLLHLIDRLMEESTAWVNTLVSFEQRLRDTRTAYWEQSLAARSVAAEWVVCPDEIDQMYKEEKDQAIHQGSEQLRFTWEAATGKFHLSYLTGHQAGNDRWSILSETGIAQHLTHFRRFWQHIQAHTVEEILIKQGETPEKVLEALKYKAAPLVSVDDTIQVPAEKMLNVLASQSKTFWQAFVGQTGLSIVATGNPHRISLLSSCHGINPLDGLMQSQTWQQAYEEAMAAGHSPHVFPHLISPVAVPVAPSVAAGQDGHLVGIGEEVVNGTV